MAEEGVWSTGENCRETFPVDREKGMAHPIYTGMHSMQMSGFDRAINRAARIAERAGQLTNRDHSVLSLCKFRQRSSFS
jgi:hypothetical protein